MSLVLNNLVNKIRSSSSSLLLCATARERTIGLGGKNQWVVQVTISVIISRVDGRQNDALSTAEDITHDRPTTRPYQSSKPSTFTSSTSDDRRPVPSVRRRVGRADRQGARATRPAFARLRSPGTGSRPRSSNRGRRRPRPKAGASPFVRQLIARAARLSSPAQLQCTNHARWHTVRRIQCIFQDCEFGVSTESWGPHLLDKVC